MVLDMLLVPSQQSISYSTFMINKQVQLNQLTSSTQLEMRP